ncbi:MAG TPA: hypothetical protein VIH45_04240 [Desulfuromonadaceae bacterium]
MEECLTKPLTPAFSGCLVDAPACTFAVRFGFSYLCEHPRHREFHPDAAATGHEVDHNALYRALKESRRSVYLSKIKQLIEDLEQGA